MGEPVVMALIHRERFINSVGQTYELERHDHGDGDVTYFITAPDGRRHLVRRELVR